jgi:hypothetical protein
MKTSMNQRPNVPDEIFLGREEYSWRNDWRVNGWLFVATIISAFSDIMFPHLARGWPLGGRVGLVLAQFLAIILWARSLTRWIRGMDELHRRISGTAVLFSISATFFFLMLWHRLDRAGLFDAIFPAPKTGGSWDICTVGHGFLLLTLFYFAGYSVCNRRFK